jgi:hypothetical protein
MTTNETPPPMTAATPTTTTTPTTPRRPGGVTFVVVLAYIASIFMVLEGLLLVFDADQTRAQVRSGMTENQLIAAAIVLMVLGVIGILLTGALARGSQVVRVLFAVWIVFQIVGGLYGTIATPAHERGAAIVPLVFGIVVLYLLFNRSAHDFFEGD